MYSHQAGWSAAHHVVDVVPVVTALAGKVVAITGAGSGIGRTCATWLARAGASIVVNDIHPDALAETVEMVTSVDGNAVGCAGDVRLLDDVRAVVDCAVSTYGRLDVMVANAAISTYVGFETMSLEEMDLVLETDLRGALLCAQQAIPALRAAGGGSIIFLSSVQAFVTLPGCVPYAAAKAGLVAAARALAVEVGRDGIRVNSIAPGTIDTPMLQRDLSGMNLEEAEAFRQRVDEASALGRVGRPEEIAACVEFLASDASSYVTGTNLTADGGYLAVKRI
jgi:NAD(P)-dependent dehydrogenase (short-subunit alcohol dehydrogenase family)